MSSKSKKIRKKLFDIFSKNLTVIKSHPDVKFKPDFRDGYICPLCFDPFFEEDLDKKSENPLTLEDVPPKSLGGNPKILTCKKCNSESGHILDNNLLNRLKEIDAREFLPNSEYRTTLLRNGHSANALVQVDKNGKIVFDIQPQWSDPKSTNRFIKDVLPPKTIYNPLFHPEKQFEPYRTNKFSIKMPDGADERRGEVALLRIGYLLAYSILGNAFLINGGLFKVREQILNPDKAILPREFGINYEFREEFIGMNINKSPKELMCYLAIFNLKTKSKIRQFAIALPGPSSPGIEIYNNIGKLLCNEKVGVQNLRIEHIPDMDFVKNLNYAWGAHIFWQKYTGDLDGCSSTNI